jgi:hypothetical protein
MSALTPEAWREAVSAQLFEHEVALQTSTAPDERVRFLGLIAGTRRALRVTKGMTDWKSMRYALRAASEQLSVPAVTEGFKRAHQLALHVETLFAQPVVGSGFSGVE